MIRGIEISLSPALPKDRYDIYYWSMHSDIAHMMVGPPHYPELPTTTWEEFKIDFEDYYFSDERPLDGRCFIILYQDQRAGQINYNQIDRDQNMVEIDIWLAGSAFTRKGIASDAINTLARWLHERYDCSHFILAPSARNKGAVACYRKLGFDESTDIPDWFEPDYEDYVFLMKKFEE